MQWSCTAAAGASHPIAGLSGHRAGKGGVGTVPWPAPQPTPPAPPAAEVLPEEVLLEAPKFRPLDPQLLPRPTPTVLAHSPDPSTLLHREEQGPRQQHHRRPPEPVGRQGRHQGPPTPAVVGSVLGVSTVPPTAAFHCPDSVPTLPEVSRTWTSTRAWALPPPSLLHSGGHVVPGLHD